ncbi:MAG: hypothetical protein ACKOSR_07975, partial [Flavobacteriales bacterium]
NAKKTEPIRTIILGSEEEKTRVENVLSSTQVRCEIFPVSQSSIEAFTVERAANSFADFIRVEKIKQIIFCAADVDAATIISLMALGGNHLEYKIVPPEALYIIGSGKINTVGSDIVQEVNSISLPHNRRLKRCIDVCVALALIITAPISIWFANKPLRVVSNCLSVIFNRKSWIGKTTGSPQISALSLLKPGVIMPSYASDGTGLGNVSVKKHLLYIKDYNPLFDIRLIWSARKSWGE